jgi:hypothetical protein
LLTARPHEALPLLHDPMEARPDSAQQTFSDEFTQVVVEFPDIERTGWKETGTFRPAGAETELLPSNESGRYWKYCLLNECRFWSFEQVSTQLKPPIQAKNPLSTGQGALTPPGSGVQAGE